jgi:hypothetical protein
MDNMNGIDNLEKLYVLNAFIFQLILIIHFAFRKWRFDLAMRYGPFVYVLGVLAAAVSTLMLLGGKSWFLWIGGYINLAWGIYGYWIEYEQKIEWRNPISWPIFGSYIFLYLSTAMFYWWPLALIYKPLWYIYAVLFITSTFLNLSSHKKNVPLNINEERI